MARAKVPPRESGEGNQAYVRRLASLGFEVAAFEGQIIGSPNTGEPRDFGIEGQLRPDITPQQLSSLSVSSGDTSPQSNFVNLFGSFFEQTPEGLLAVSDPATLRGLRSGDTASTALSSTAGQSFATPQLQAPSAPQAISTATTAPTPTFQTAPTPSVPDVSKLPEINLTGEESRAQNLSERLQTLNQQLAGQSTFRAEQETAQGLPELRRTQQDLTSRLQSLKAEQASIPLRLEEGAVERGLTTRLLGRQENALLRENAIKSLTTSALLQATQGNIATALDAVERAVDARFGPIKEEIAINKGNLDLIISSPLYDAQDKARAKTVKESEDAKKRAIEEQENDMRIIFNIAVDAAESGNVSSFNLKKIQEASTPEEALRLAVQAGAFTGTITSTGEKPLSVNQLDTFRRNFGWTPPLGFTMTQLQQFMQDNPNATPQELEAGARQASQQTGQTETTRFLSEDYFRQNFTDKELKTLSDKAGTSSFFTPRSVDISRFLRETMKKVEAARQAGHPDQEILEFLTQ